MLPCSDPRLLLWSRLRLRLLLPLPLSLLLLHPCLPLHVPNSTVTLPLLLRLPLLRPLLRPLPIRLVAILARQQQPLRQHHLPFTTLLLFAEHPLPLLLQR